MKKIFTVLLLSVVCLASVHAQQKKLLAKSFINQKAPALTIEKWITARPTTKGKFVLLDFWATWCGPCKMVIPKLNDFHNEFVNDLVVIGLSDESKSTIKRMKSPIIEYFNAIDKSKKLNRAYRVKGIPHCVLIDPSGFVIWEGNPGPRGFNLTSKVIHKLIKDYKAKK